MTIAEGTLPDDADVLKTMVMELATSHTALEEEVAAKGEALTQYSVTLAEFENEISYLREQIRLLTHKRFGASSEKLSREQLRLFLESDESMETEGVETENTVSVKEHRRRKCGRRPLPASLPRIDVIHDLSDEEKICPNDGETLKKIGEETSEQLSYIPATMRVLRHVRFKYACPRCEDGVKIAALPPQAIPKSMAAPSLLAHVTVSKYADALPLYRQSKMLERIGIDLPRATLANWMIAAGELVQPLINLLRDDLLSGPVIQCDETRCQVLKEPGKPAQSQSYLWAERGGTAESPVILFDYDPSRSGEVPKRLLAGYVGYLQTDGYKGYDAVCEENAGIRRAGCMAHARRKFDEAFKVQLSAKGKKGKSRSKRLQDSKANQGLGYIRKLYDIERHARGMSAEERKEIRQARAQPILDELRKWMQATKDLVPPRSLTGRALMYLSDRWKYLIRYLEDGCLEIDNNLVENAIRPFCLGRRNWLFNDTVRGAEAGANLYSLIETAKAQGLESFQYLCYVFRELPGATRVEEIECLLPRSWSSEGIATALARDGPPI
jgi:transposase/uncharacterized coiled-coil protein SlyX